MSWCESTMPVEGEKSACSMYVCTCNKFDWDWCTPRTHPPTHPPTHIHHIHIQYMLTD